MLGRNPLRESSVNGQRQESEGYELPRKENAVNTPESPDSVDSLIEEVFRENSEE